MKIEFKVSFRLLYGYVGVYRQDANELIVVVLW